MLRLLKCCGPCALAQLAVTFPASAAEGFVPFVAQAAAAAVQPSKSYTVEAGVVLVLFGAAIFAVCRSSRRS